MSSAIEVEVLSKRFGAFTAVDAVSFEVQPGEIFGYLGANGAGKSTTIKMLCGLSRPSSGSARVAGRDITASAGAVKTQIGYMSQRFSLYLDLPVAANLAFFAGAYAIDEPETRISRVAAQLGLEELLSRTCRHLSGGTRQRVALACALLHRPSVVFLDEPTAGVDPRARRDFWAVIRELARSGTTIFVTTHHLDEAEGCDRVGMMVDGRLVALGTPAELKRAHVPGTMLRVRSELRRRLRAEIENTWPDLQVESFGRALHVSCGEREVEDIGRVVRELDSEAEIVPITASLEDVFLRLSRRQAASKPPARSA